MENVRLTVSAAAIAAGVDRKTLQRRLNEAKEAPAADGKFELAQIFHALCGGLQNAKLRSALANAELDELDLAERRHEMLSAFAVESTWMDIITTCRSIIESAEMPRASRMQLLKQLQAIPIKEYADAAERGDEADEDESREDRAPSS